MRAERVGYVAASVGSIVLVAAACALACYYMGIGVDFQDECYEIMNSLDPRATPMAPLSAWLTGVMARLLGFEGALVEYRALSFAVSCCAIAASCAVCVVWLRRPFPAVLTAGALTVAAGGATGFLWYYGWDVFSNASLALLVCAGVCCLRRPGAGSAALFGAVAAVAVLFRVPDVVVVPPAMLFVALCCPDGRRLRSVSAFTIAFVLVAIALLAVVYDGNLPDVVRSWRDNAPGDHDNLLYRLVNGMIWFMPVLCMTACLLFYIRKLCSAGIAAVWRVPAVLAGMLAVALAVRLTVWPGNAPFHFLEALVVVPLLYVLFSGGGRPGMRPVACLLLMCGLASVAGSNTGFTKFLSVDVLPFYASLVFMSGSRPLRIWFVGMSVAFLAVTADLNRRRFLTDTGTREAVAVVEEGVMRGLRTSPAMASYVRSAGRFAEELDRRGKKAVVIGRGLNRFGWEYMFDARFEPVRHRFFVGGTDGDYAVHEAAVRCFLDTLQSRDVVVLVPAPFVETAQGLSFGPVDGGLDSLLCTRMRRLPLSTPRLHVYALAGD